MPEMMQRAADGRHEDSDCHLASGHTDGDAGHHGAATALTVLSPRVEQPGPATTRREWLRGCGRWSLAALLVWLSGVLVRRRMQGPCTEVSFACGQCVQLQECGLPRAVNYRTSRKG